MELRKILLAGLFLLVGCGSYNDNRLSFYNYYVVQNEYPNHKIKEFKRFSYIFDVYNKKDSLKVFVNSNREIYKTIKLK